MAQHDRLIAAMAKAGTKPAKIAQKLQLRPEYVQGRISFMRRLGEDIPHFNSRVGMESVSSSPQPGKALMVPENLRTALETAAKKRGLTATEYAARILEDRLFGCAHD